MWSFFGALFSIDYIKSAIVLWIATDDTSQFFGRLLYSTADYAGTLLTSIFIIGFPVIFRRTFGELPFEAVRTRMRPTSRATIELRNVHTEGDVIITAGDEEGGSALREDVSIRYIDSLDPRQALTLYAEQSKKVASAIYTRAGVYLIIGVSIAFLGIGFAYVRLNNIPEAKDPLEHLLLLLPGFGILFFIEFVALFFLRQYRSAMDEFRYYDAVSRYRQENVVALKMFKESSLVVPTKEVLGSMSIYSSAGKFLSGETSDIIESRKMQRDELVFMETIAAAFAQYKKSEDKDEKSDKKDK